MNPDREDLYMENLLLEVFEYEKLFPGGDLLTEMIGEAEYSSFLDDEELMQVFAAKGINIEENNIKKKLLLRIKENSDFN